MKSPKGRPEPLAPLPCPLPYDASGAWTTATTSAARQCVLNNLERDLKWWRKKQQTCAAGSTPDVDATLCRVRSQGPRSVLTNMMLLRNVRGRLSAMILLDPGDERGPMRHWPGRPVAAIQQLAAVQQSIDEGRLRPLPENFTAILNPHDSPNQFARYDWCGHVPLLSNSRVSGENRDLMMPDFSFAPFSYLTNMIAANLSAAMSVPRGWAEERAAIYAAGKRLPYAAKQRTLFWRGGETHEQRRVYSTAVVEKRVALPAQVRSDVRLCGAHCSLQEGVPPEAWCDHKQLLSLPGHSFAVGFKYTLLCSSLVVRGAHPTKCQGSKCPRVYEQFWHAGLREDEHFVSSAAVDDLGTVVTAADGLADAALVASHSGSYAYHVLDPDFITEYWHALLSGYAGMFDWASASSPAADVCARGHRQNPTNPPERVCFRGTGGKCHFKLLGVSDDDFVPVPSLRTIAAKCNSTEGMQSLYRRFAHVVPLRMTGSMNVSVAAANALAAWKDGSFRKAPRN